MSWLKALPLWPGTGRGSAGCCTPQEPGLGTALPCLGAALSCLIHNSYTETGFGLRNILIPHTLHSRSRVLTRSPQPKLLFLSVRSAVRHSAGAPSHPGDAQCSPSRCHGMLGLHPGWVPALKCQGGCLLLVSMTHGRVRRMVPGRVNQHPKGTREPFPPPAPRKTW